MTLRTGRDARRTDGGQNKAVWGIRGSGSIVRITLALWFLAHAAAPLYASSNKGSNGKDKLDPVLAALAEKRALVPILWFYEVGNGLLMALRRHRISFDQVEAFVIRLKALRAGAAIAVAALVLAAVAYAAGHTVRLNLQGGYANKTLSACGNRHHYTFYHRSRRIHFNGSVSPSPSTRSASATRSRRTPPAAPRPPGCGWPAMPPT